MQEKILYNFALQYLTEKINNLNILTHYLTLYKFNTLTSIEDAFEKILESAKERQGMPHTIGDIEPLKSLLFNLDPKQISLNFPKWEDVFLHLQKNYNPPGRMEITNKRSYWVIFSKSIFTSAVFLNRFDSIQGFNTYCDSFLNGNSDMKIALPLLLSQEIKGFGFALACNFLKDWVSPYFPKPDTHTKDIFIGTGFCSPNDSDFNICRKIIQFSESINEPPYSVDKIFWLIGSGKLHKTNTRKKDEYFKTSKQEFIQLYNANR